MPDGALAAFPLPLELVFETLEFAIEPPNLDSDGVPLPYPADEPVLVDEASLRPYYAALSAIRRVYDKFFHEYGPGSWACANGFVSWPEPNGFCHRTRDCLLLVTTRWRAWEGMAERFSLLCTPFGEVKLFGSGPEDLLCSVSSAMFADPFWDLEDVTGRVCGYIYWAPHVSGAAFVQRGPIPVSTKKDTVSGTFTRYYLVRRVDEWTLPGPAPLVRPAAREGVGHENVHECTRKRKRADVDWQSGPVTKARRTGSWTGWLRLGKALGVEEPGGEEVAECAVKDVWYFSGYRDGDYDRHKATFERLSGGRMCF
jgi:hypothetical protein